MIPFGPWHPDKAGVNVEACREAANCIPAVNGYRPLRSPTAVTTELDSDCLGASVLIDNEGSIHTFAGDTAKLYKLLGDASWDDVSRTTGGAYAAGVAERWQFATVGSLVIAVNIATAPQKYDLQSSTNFEPLGGTPPTARYIATVRDFVVLGGLYQDELTLQWSGNNNPEHWTAGTQESDSQTFQNGGPIRGILGGEVGYVFQANKLHRMTYQPGSDVIFSFDEVEGGRGLAAPYSLVKVGAMAFYLAADGFYRLDTVGASSQPLGVGKWGQWFLDDLKSGYEGQVIGGLDPVGRFLVFAYVSAGNVNNTLDRLLIYDWTLDEATFVDALTVTALGQVLTLGVNLDTMDSFGNMETLGFSLDSPAWRGGSSLLALFGPNGAKAMQLFTGSPLAARFVSNDGERPRRTLVRGLRPHVDTRAITAEVSCREAEGDAVTWGNVEVMEDTGAISTWASGWLARARLRIPAGTTWSKITGMTVDAGDVGRR